MPRSLDLPGYGKVYMFSFWGTRGPPFCSSSPDCMQQGHVPLHFPLPGRQKHALTDGSTDGCSCQKPLLTGKYSIWTIQKIMDVLGWSFYIYIYTVHFKHDSIMLSSVANFGAVPPEGWWCPPWHPTRTAMAFSMATWATGSVPRCYQWVPPFLGQWGSTLGIPWAPGSKALFMVISRRKWWTF